MTFTDQLRDRRTVLAGAAGLGLAAVAGATLTRAQSTPEATDTDTDTTGDTDRAAMAAERYQDFVGRLGTALGSDATTVDAAIRSSLTGMVDDTLAAGEISANDAETARTAIAEADAPLVGLFLAGRRSGGRGGGFGGFGERGGPGGRGGRPDGDDPDADTTDTTTETTTEATPSATS